MDTAKPAWFFYSHTPRCMVSIDMVILGVCVLVYVCVGVDVGLCVHACVCVLTGLFQFVLVVVQGLICLHADPAHSDLQVLRKELLTEHTRQVRERGGRRGEE